MFNGSAVSLTNEVVNGTITVQTFNGCTPGFWKNNLAAWATIGVATNQTLSGAGFSFSNISGVSSSDSLLTALGYKGGSGMSGAAQILLRAAAAAYLNAYANPTVGNYPLTTSQITTQVNAALASGDRSTILALASTLDGYNNGGCFMDAHGNVITPTGA